MKAVLALEERDFKRHKDVMAYFNQKYVAADVFPRDIGRKHCQIAAEQIGYTQEVVALIADYLEKNL